MANDDELKKTIIDWLNGQLADFYVEGIKKLAPCLNKSLNFHGDYMEKHGYVVACISI